MEKVSISSPSRGKKTKAIVCLAVLLFACSPFSFAAEPVINRVALSQKVIDLAQNEKAVIEFQLSEKAAVDLIIYDEADTLVREIKGEKFLGKGKHTLEWDGVDEKGEQVVSGVYIYVLEARGKRPFRYDPSKNTGGEEVLVQNLSWDVPKATIHYLLPKAGYVRTRIGLKGGVFLGTLHDWTPLDAGNKEFPWDGRDPNGYFDLGKHPEAQINISAFALPDNAVIVVSPSLRGSGATEAISKPWIASSSRPSGGTPRNDDSSSPTIYSQRPNGGGYIHSRHPRARCHEPKFQVEFPDAQNKSLPLNRGGKVGVTPADFPPSLPSPARGEGAGNVKLEDGQVPILKGNAPIRITLDPEDKDYLVANRFEVMFFVDSVFLFEQEEATSPLTIDLDSKQLGAGEHLLTVNIMDYEDHIGVQTVKVKAESQ